jgi:hypothetical protein
MVTRMLLTQIWIILQLDHCCWITVVRVGLAPQTGANTPHVICANPAICPFR